MTREAKDARIEVLTKASTKHVSKILSPLFTDILPTIRQNTSQAHKSLKELACILLSLILLTAIRSCMTKLGMTYIMLHISSLFSQLSQVVETVSSKLEETFDAKAQGEMGEKSIRVAVIEKQWTKTESKHLAGIRDEEKKAKKRKENPTSIEDAGEVNYQPSIPILLHKMLSATYYSSTSDTDTERDFEYSFPARRNITPSPVSPPSAPSIDEAPIEIRKQIPQIPRISLQPPARSSFSHTIEQYLIRCLILSWIFL
jgi:hypothetical protein